MPNSLEQLFRRLLAASSPFSRPPEMAQPIALRGQGPQMAVAGMPPDRGGPLVPYGNALPHWLNRRINALPRELGIDPGLGPSEMSVAAPLFGMAKGIWELYESVPGVARGRFAAKYPNLRHLAQEGGDVEQAAQNALVKVAEKADTIDPEKLESYAYMAADNAVRDLLRNQGVPEARMQSLFARTGEEYLGSSPGTEVIGDGLRAADDASDAAASIGRPAVVGVAPEHAKLQDLPTDSAVSERLSEMFQASVAKIVNPLKRRAAEAMIAGKPLLKELPELRNTAAVARMTQDVKETIQAISKTGMDPEAALREAIPGLRNRVQEHIAARYFIDHATERELAAELKTSNTTIHKMLQTMRPRLERWRNAILTKAAQRNKR